MGQILPSMHICHYNDELVSSLIKHKNILSKDLEKVFRCVDRGVYIAKEDINIAYCDSVWLSTSCLTSPSIYASIFESLKLQKGHKFLCIGSKNGYVNTVAGLLLDDNGVNHGIETSQSKIDNALQKLEEFKLNAAAIDYYNFCEPDFIHGNACDLLPTGYYDRVYCSTNVPAEELEFFKSLINTGGVLVLPFEGILLQFTRKDKHTWKTDSLKELDLPFSDLVVPSKNSFNEVKFPTVYPLRLEELCRSKIRSVLRSNINAEFPDLSIDTKLDSKCHSKNEKDEDTDSESQFCSGFLDNCHNHELNEQEFVIDNYSDTGEEEGGEIEENVVGQHLPHLALSKPSDESAKTKSLEVGDSEKNKMGIEGENLQKMKINISSEKSESTRSTSPNSDSDSWETVFTYPSRSSSYYDSESLDSSIDNYDIDDDDDDDLGDCNVFLHHPIGGLYFGDDSETDSEDARDSVNYRFINDFKNNKFSVLLMAKINLLPIPVKLKNFLNYYRSN